MNPYISISLIIVYFVFLYFLAHIVSKNATNESFFTGNKNSHWLLVSFGMIGTSLSGVTFVSVPGTVAQNGFSYMQVVFGYVVGYIVIAFVLTPLYYKLKVVSIYNYLQIRFGTIAYKSGAIFFYYIKDCRCNRATLFGNKCLAGLCCRSNRNTILDNNFSYHRNDTALYF